MITEDDEGLGDAQVPSTKIGGAADAASPAPDGAVANHDKFDARTLISLYTALQSELAATRRQVIDIEAALQQKQEALAAREAAFEKQSQLIADLSSDIGQLKAAKQTKKQIKKDVAKDVNELKLSLALVESENRRLRGIGDEVQNAKREWKAIHDVQQKELNRMATRMEELARVQANSDEDSAKRKPRGRGSARRKKEEEEMEGYEEVEEEEAKDEEEAHDDEKDSPSVIRRSARLQAKEAPKVEQAKASPKRIAKRRSREAATAVSAPTKPTPPPPAKAESPAKRGRPRKVVEDEQDEETKKKQKDEDSLESEAEETEDLEIDEGEEEEEEEDVDNEPMVDTYGEPTVVEVEETREKIVEEPTDAKAVMQQRRERRRAEREKAEASAEAAGGGTTTGGKKRKMETRAKGAEEATAKKKAKKASAEQDKESSPTDEAAASKLKSPAKAAGAKESKLMKMVKTKAKAEQAMRSQQLTRAPVTAPATLPSVAPLVPPGPTSEPVMTTPTPSAARVWPPPPPGTTPRPAVAWPPPPPGSAALPATVGSLVAAVRPALVWPPPPPGTAAPQAAAPISPAPAAPSAATSSSTTTSPMGPTRDRRSDEAPADYFNRRVALLSGVTLREIADDFAQERNLDEQTVMSLLERRLLQTFETERTKKREHNQRGEEAWMKRFANQEKLVLRLLWRVAKARAAAAAAARQPQDKHEHGDRLLDSVLWSWANRLANKHEPKVATTELESLCKAFAGLCKLERRRGRSIVGVFCLDLVLAALSKTEAGRRPPRAGQVLQYLRIVSRAYPGALASVEGDDGSGAAMDLEEADDGLRVLGLTLRLLMTGHLGPAAKSTGSGAKRERTKMVDDCLADIATENDWNEENAPSLDRLLADIVSGIGSLAQHNGDESYKLTPRTFVGLKCLELVALWKGWVWTFNDLIVERLWPLLGADSTNSALVTTVRAVGQLARAAIQFLAEPLPLQGSDFLANTMADVLQMDPADSPMGTFSVKLAAAQTILEMTTSAAAGSLPPSSSTSGPATGVRSWIRSLSPAHAKRVPPALVAAIGKR